MYITRIPNTLLLPSTVILELQGYEHRGTIPLTAETCRGITLLISATRLSWSHVSHIGSNGETASVVIKSGVPFENRSRRPERVV